MVRPHRTSRPDRVYRPPWPCKPVPSGSATRRRHLSSFLTASRLCVNCCDRRDAPTRPEVHPYMSAAPEPPPPSCPEAARRAAPSARRRAAWRDPKRHAWLLGLVVPTLPFLTWGLVEATGVGALWFFGPVLVFGIFPAARPRDRHGRAQPARRRDQVARAGPLLPVVHLRVHAHPVRGARARVLAVLAVRALDRREDRPRADRRDGQRRGDQHRPRARPQARAASSAGSAASRSPSRATGTSSSSTTAATTSKSPRRRTPRAPASARASTRSCPAP